ncbi:hypothetical protein ASG67_04125 [Sphingomonas sp. Leaf339]|nr:hypothetical protein ASG67_04125 [Sphingomonas sp. Leaf339]
MAVAMIVDTGMTAAGVGIVAHGGMAAITVIAGAGTAVIAVVAAVAWSVTWNGDGTARSAPVFAAIADLTGPCRLERSGPAKHFARIRDIEGNIA